VRVLRSKKMDQEQIKRIIEDTYDVSREDTILSMAKDFYSRKMLSTAILVWAFGIIFFAGAAYCAMQFLKTDNTKSQIMYAAIFIPCVLGIGFMKVFAWEMVHRHSIKREIKRLELRIAELAETVKGK
jgi:uncharacterized membrane protein YbjE (DUF340 family)